MQYCRYLGAKTAQKKRRLSPTLSGSPQAEYTMTKSAPYVVQTQ